VAIAVVGHEGLAFLQKIREDGMPFFFSKKNNGVMILGIIPDSPASKMELKVGELITKVNGSPVTDDKDFYEALQKNRAYCKLEVFDTNGEVRFEQRALYEGDHYELGILFVQDERDGAKIG
jgi:S1-C subfamily serine protease